MYLPEYSNIPELQLSWMNSGKESHKLSPGVPS